MPDVDISIVAIIAAVVINMVFGMLWYSPMLFGNMWAKSMGTTLDKLQKAGNPAVSMSVTVLLTIILGATLDYFSNGLGLEGAMEGLMFGLVVAGGIVVTTIAPDYIFANRPKMSLIMHAAYQFIAVTLISVAVTLIG
ncbi:MAG TPA: DUF1761 domain-containing protein [Candidatus Dojkabacteria bacterium]|jgi:hypothetical protein